MLRDVEQLLDTATYQPQEIERVLDGDHPPFIRFDPELGYVLNDYVFRDGPDESLCEYTYDPVGGHRRLVNAADRPCRINTYGDSYTQCAQVNDGETWQEILAGRFREPIRNFGVGGYGFYQAYRRALRVEATDLAAEYVVVNIWDDDHLRNLDAARWLRVAWSHRHLPRGGGEDTYPAHGFPWAHVRYDLDQQGFAERPGLLQRAEDLRRLTDRRVVGEAFGDDEIVHLFTLSQGGEAPTDRLEALAEAFGVAVDLRNPARRAADARALHVAYGLRSSIYILDKLLAWARQAQRKVMVLLSYDAPQVKRYLETHQRFDETLLEYLRAKRVPHVDCLDKALQDYQDYNLPADAYLKRFYIDRAGAQVFDHYNPYGNFWFASAIREELIDWLEPKPPAYR